MSVTGWKPARSTEVEDWGGAGRCISATAMTIRAAAMASATGTGIRMDPMNRSFHHGVRGPKTRASSDAGVPGSCHSFRRSLSFLSSSMGQSFRFEQGPQHSLQVFAGAVEAGFYG